jgi:hypothetical protein
MCFGSFGNKKKTQLPVIALTSEFCAKSLWNREVNICFGVDIACLNILDVACLRDEPCNFEFHVRRRNGVYRLVQAVRI